jgi:hypothetical protein
MDAQEKCYSVKEVSGLWSCGVDTIRRNIKKGDLKAFYLTVNAKKGRRKYCSLRILASSVAEFMRRRAA